MKNKTTTYPVNEVLGFSITVREMLATCKEQMIAAGINPTMLIGTLGTSHATLNLENTTQEGMKTQLRAQTVRVEASKGDTYVLSSQGCDQIITVFGRGSPQAKAATRLRNGLRHKRRSAKRPPDSVPNNP